MIMKKQILITLLLAIMAVTAGAQMQDPVHFSVSQKKVADDMLEVTFSGKIDAGWHVYSTALPADGPISATITTETADGVKAEGALGHRGNEINKFDNMFQMNLRYFENSVTFVQKYKITGKTYHIKGYLEYGSCNDEMCMPPAQVEFDFKGEGPADAPKEPAVEEKPAPDTVAVADTAHADTATVAVPASVDTAGLWTPVISELQAFNGGQGSEGHSWIYIFFMGFVGGLVALFTPCVWPIIPMTVSFFLKRSKDKKKGVRDAMTYGVSIVVIYLVLGLAITGIMGASALNALSTNAVFNIFFCLLLVVFALSFFGWFELTLPSSWTNKVDNKASSTSGLLSIFLMAFTLTLVSFSCTGPIIGFLLVEVSTSGSITGPAVGMAGFAIALALPFTLFALFPTWLKQAPKSGSWMNTIKVTLGFIELAFALKFFSVADLAYGWGLLDREVFLSLWIVIFGLLGLYLIGKLKFRSDGDDTKAMPVPCIMLGLLPRFKDYEQGMAAARAEGKPVLIDFTGFGCVNCRKMEASVWTDPQVADRLNNDFVLISLYVDDKQPLPQPIEIVENGKKRTLRTVGDKWSYLQRSKFGANAQPFYVILDAEGRPLAGSYSYDEDISHYTDFLDKGLQNHKK